MLEFLSLPRELLVKRYSRLPLLNKSFITPHYQLRFGRPSDAGVGSIQDVAEGADIDIVVHQYPSWTKVGYTLAEMLEMVKLPRVVCIKMGTRILADLISLAPALRVRYPAVPPNPALEPQAEQQRLYESAFSFFVRLANRAPLLLVLEDMHWADGGTLALLRSLARRFRQTHTPVLILLTYREVELNEQKGLADLLTLWHRDRMAHELKLHRFDRQGTQDVLEALLAKAVLILDASRGISSTANQPVSEWRDLSSHMHHASQSDADRRPVLIPDSVNGQPAVRFDGQRRFLNLAGGLVDMDPGPAGPAAWLGEAAAWLGAAAVAELPAALLALAAQRLAAGELGAPAGLVPAYVALPRGVSQAAEELRWSPDLR